jgi:hypothetical protein
MQVQFLLCHQYQVWWCRRQNRWSTDWGTRTELQLRAVAPAPVDLFGFFVSASENCDDNANDHHTNRDEGARADKLIVTGETVRRLGRWPWTDGRRATQKMVFISSRSGGVISWAGTLVIDSVVDLWLEDDSGHH